MTSSQKSRGASSARTLCGFVPVVLLVAGVLVGYDVRNDGPYSLSFNTRCRKLFEDANLRGKSEQAVVSVLGTPTVVRDGGYGRRGMDYYAYPGIPYNKFQVHIHNGVCVSYDFMDD